MMDLEAFEAMVEAIQAQGYSREQAEDFAGLIGDTPMLDADGMWLVIDTDGKTLARLEPVE